MFGTTSIFKVAVTGTRLLRRLLEVAKDSMADWWLEINERVHEELSRAANNYRAWIAESENLLNISARALESLPGPMLAPSTFALAGILGVPMTHVAELSGYQLLTLGLRQ
jgi:hypothetical protein